MPTVQGSTQGVGALFRRWNSTSATWVNVAGINSITGPGLTRDTIETTDLDNTDLYRTFKGAFRDGGSVGLNMKFTEDEYVLLKADFENNTPQNYEIVLDDDVSTSLEFEGLVTELPLDIPADADITMDVSIKVSGKPVLETGSGPSPG